MAMAPGGPPQTQPPQQGAPQSGGQQNSPAAMAINSIQKGFEMIGQMMQKAQGQVDPQDMKLFQTAVQATDNFIQSISGPQQPVAAQRPQQSGPMAANANQGAKPSPNQG